jgi:hypothetical protein
VSQQSNGILDRLKQKPRGGDAEREPDVENEDEEVPKEDEAVREGSTDLEPLAAQVNQPYHVKDWSQAEMGRYPRPVTAPDLPPLATLGLGLGCRGGRGTNVSKCPS